MQMQPANDQNHISTATNRIKSIRLNRDRSPSLRPKEGSIPAIPYQFPKASTPIGPKLSNCSRITVKVKSFFIVLILSVSFVYLLLQKKLRLVQDNTSELAREPAR